MGKMCNSFFERLCQDCFGFVGLLKAKCNFCKTSELLKSFSSRSILSQWTRKIKQGWRYRYGIRNVQLKPCLPNKLAIIWYVITVELGCEDRFTHGDTGAMAIVKNIVPFPTCRPGLTGLNIAVVG